MPLIKSGSKKAFKHNVEVEMTAHPDKRAQDLAISYSIQRKNKRHYADGTPQGGVKAMPIPSDPSQSSQPSTSAGAMQKGGQDIGTGISGMIKGKAHGGKIQKYASGGEVSMLKEEYEEDGEPKNIHAGAKDNYSSPAMREYMSSKQNMSGSDTPEDSDEEVVPHFADGGNVDLEEAHIGEPCPHCEGRGHMKAEMPIDEDHDELDHESIADAVMAKRKWMAMGGEVDADDEDPFDHGEGISHYQEEGPGTRVGDNMKARNYNAGDDRQLSKQPKDSNEDGDDLADEDENDMVGSIRKKMKSKRG